MYTHCLEVMTHRVPKFYRNKVTGHILCLFNDLAYPNQEKLLDEKSGLIPKCHFYFAILGCIHHISYPMRVNYLTSSPINSTFHIRMF